jgi:hypothetical protein
MNQIRDPIDAQARGRRRVYKQKLAADYAVFDATWRSFNRSQVEDFMLKNGKGRRRIFDRINAAVTRCGGRLEALPSTASGHWRCGRSSSRVTPSASIPITSATTKTVLP